MMHYLKRVFVFPGPSSNFIKSLFLLLLFAGSLSTVPAGASHPAENDDTVTSSIPKLFPNDSARLLATATAAQKELVMPHDTESEDMQHSQVNKEDAIVESDTSDKPADTEATTVASTESSTQASVTSSPIPIVVSMSTESVDVTVESNSTTSAATLSLQNLTTPTSITSSTTEITMTTTELTTTTKLTPSTTSQPDSIESGSTAKAFIANGGGGMPTGIVALVTIITFAIIAVGAYVGLIVWRRYLEYRYGNRELLVNDLEFDTNDLRHFEL